METSAECICCNEIPNVLTKKQENNSSIKCITEHPGFEAVCLNVWKTARKPDKNEAVTQHKSRFSKQS